MRFFGIFFLIAYFSGTGRRKVSILYTRVPNHLV
jgi:hypothetical protein